MGKRAVTRWLLDMTQLLSAPTQFHRIKPVELPQGIKKESSRPTSTQRIKNIVLKVYILQIHTEVLGKNHIALGISFKIIWRCLSKLDQITAKTEALQRVPVLFWLWVKVNYKSYLLGGLDDKRNRSYGVFLLRTLTWEGQADLQLLLPLSNHLPFSLWL